MKAHVKRILSLVLTFALVFAIPFAFTQEASAASKKSSKKVTVYKMLSETTVSTFSDGSKSTSTYKCKYNKKGFMTQAVYSSESYYYKDVYKYNGKGYMKSCKTYDKKGKLTNEVKVTMKKGKPYIRKHYTVKGKKKTLTYQEKLIYKGKKLVRVDWKDLVEKTKGSYNPNESTPSTGPTVANRKLDEHGNVIEETSTDSYSDGSLTYTTEYKTVYKYTYDSAGNVLRKESTETSTTTASDGTKMEPSTWTSVTTYTYKKMNIQKKYLTLG